MKIKIQMTKRLMVVICIVITAVSFMGGMIYKYEDYVPMVEVDLEQAKYVFKYHMPLDRETAIYWLDWAAEGYHQLCINACKPSDTKELEYHRDFQKMYREMKELYLEFDEEWSDEW